MVLALSVDYVGLLSVEGETQKRCSVLEQPVTLAQEDHPIQFIPPHNLCLLFRNNIQPVKIIFCTA
jgi:hypothetical protein